MLSGVWVWQRMALDRKRTPSSLGDRAGAVAWVSPAGDQDGRGLEDWIWREAAHGLGGNTAPGLQRCLSACVRLGVEVSRTRSADPTWSGRPRPLLHSRQVDSRKISVSIKKNFCVSKGFKIDFLLQTF